MIRTSVSIEETLPGRANVNAKALNGRQVSCAQSTANELVSRGRQVKREVGGGHYAGSCRPQ